MCLVISGQNCCMVEGYCCCVADKTLFFWLLFIPCRTVVWNVGQSYAFSTYICLYSKLMWHGRTQCVYRTSYECSYVKTVAAFFGVDCSLQNRRRQWVWYNKAGALLSTWVLFANVCCLPNAPFFPERFESCPSLGTTSMIRSLSWLGQIQQNWCSILQHLSIILPHSVSLLLSLNFAAPLQLNG
jgi:hypothetical protein